MRSYGKMKTGKEKEKDKSKKRETIDEGTFKKGADERKPKKSGKGANLHLPKKKKFNDASSVDNASLYSGELANPLKSNSDNQSDGHHRHHHHRVKGKKRVSKTCEEMVTLAVSEFFECAWKACVERFFIQTAPVTVSFELRNTWLRLVEAEWQDPDMREKPSTKPNRIFKRDDPPLPLAFDTWSRGVIETMPSVRRESIMDPFLRDLDPYGKLSFPDRQFSIVSLVHDMHKDDSPSREVHEGEAEAHPEEHDHEQETTEEEEMEQTGKTAEAKKHSGENDTTEGESWNFEIDPILSKNILEPESSDIKSSFSSFAESQHSVEVREEKKEKVHVKHVHTILSARPFTWDESTTDLDTTPTHSSGKSAKIINSATRPKPVHKFSPSQCGGRVGSGVFRLPLETTSAALRRMQRPFDPNERRGPPSESRILEQHADDKHDIVQVSRKGHISPQLEEDDFEVQPLFEENPTRGNVPEDYNPDDHFLKLSVSELRFKELALDEGVASEHNKLHVRRRLINLHSRFKRQAMRSLAARVKQVEEDMKPRLSIDTVADSASSIISSSNKTNRTKTKKLGDRASRSASIPNNLQQLQISQRRKSKQTTQDFTNYLSDVTEAAKGAASEPLLHAIIKEHQHRQEQKEAKELERQIRSLGRGKQNRKMMGNVRTSFQKSDGRSFGSFSSTGNKRLNPKEMENVGGGRGRGGPQCPNGRPQNRRIICDYNDFDDPCSLQPAPCDCRPAGTCSNVTSPPRAFC